MDKRGIDWIENINGTKRGNKRCVDWICKNLSRMYRRLTDDEDKIQELMTHFFRKVLPAFNDKYYPIPIIYRAAKRILINIHKTTKKYNNEFAATGTSFLADSGIIDSVRPAGSTGINLVSTKFYSGIDRILFDFSIPENVRAMACCMFSFEYIKMLDANAKRGDLNKQIDKFLEERKDWNGKAAKSKHAQSSEVDDG